MEDMDYKIGGHTGGCFPFGGYTIGAIATGGFTEGVGTGGYTGDEVGLVIGGDDSWLSGDNGGV